MEQVEAYMFLTQAQVDDYFVEFRKDCPKHLQSVIVICPHTNDLIPYRSLKATLSALPGSDALILLYFLATLNPFFITDAIFGELPSAEISLQFLDCGAQKRLRVIQDLITSQDRLTQAREVLLSFNLIKKTPSGINIHPLIHYWASLQPDPELQQEFIISAAFTLAVKIKDIANSGHWTTPRWLSRHVDFLLDQLIHCQTAYDDCPSKLWFDAILFIKEQFAFCFWKSKRLDLASWVYKQLLGELHHYDTDEGKLRQSNVSENLGRVMWELERFEQVEVYVQRAVDRKAELLDDSILEMAEFLNNIKNVLGEGLGHDLSIMGGCRWVSTVENS